MTRKEMKQKLHKILNGDITVKEQDKDEFLSFIEENYICVFDQSELCFVIYDDDVKLAEFIII